MTNGANQSGEGDGIGRGINDDDSDSGDQNKEEAEEISFTCSFRAFHGKDEISEVARYKVMTNTTLTYEYLLDWCVSARQKALVPIDKYLMEAIPHHRKMRVNDRRKCLLMTYAGLDEIFKLLRSWHDNINGVELSLDITWIANAAAAAAAPAATAIASFALTPGPNIPAPSLAGAPASQINRGRVTATTRQLQSLPQVLEAERAAGNQGPDIADYWRCQNHGCRIYEHGSCWVKGFNPVTKEGRDIAACHYPITSYYLGKWSAEIRAGTSTVENPSANIAADLVQTRDNKPNRKRRNRSEDIDPKAFNSYPFQGMPHPMFPPQVLPYPYFIPSPNIAPNFAPPSQPPAREHFHSSPIHTDASDDEVLEDFFSWLATQPGFTTRKAQLVEICEQLAEDEYNLESLMEQRRGGINRELWEGYGWKVGLLQRIRTKISGFKQYRKARSKAAQISAIPAPEQQYDS